MAHYNFDEINANALQRLMDVRPFWIDIAPALEVVPGMEKMVILHSGPPITWERMCGPQRGAVIGALLYEGFAQTPEAAEALAASGEIRFEPCHHHGAVGPMAGVVSASMPVIVTEDEVSGCRAYNTLNEGIGVVLRMGAYSPDVLQRLRWMETVMAPALKRAIRKAGRLDLKSIMVQALGMGDELHNRSRAASYVLFSRIAPYIVETLQDHVETSAVLRFMEENIHTFLGFAMTSAKVALDAIHGIDGCSIVTAMARNGTDFGIRVSGLGDQWFTAPAPVPDVLLFPGFTREDVNPDMGDSAILETVGLGGFVIAGAPAIIQFVGGSVQEAIRRTKLMYEITVGENEHFTIPFLDFRGSPTGIDIRKVIETGITPFIDTGVAHRTAGIGQVGAGLVDAPWDVFEGALVAFVERYG
ncbi:MAG: DUF1116 domain-containing protein [Spirochaetaceae bacterium]|nr:MAG: DUF1116 domain-containing protein [Spirochaetaceae bacterium]